MRGSRARCASASARRAGNPCVAPPLLLPSGVTVPRSSADRRGRLRGITVPGRCCGPLQPHPRGAPQILRPRCIHRRHPQEPARVHARSQGPSDPHRARHDRDVRWHDAGDARRVRRLKAGRRPGTAAATAFPSGPLRGGAEALRPDRGGARSARREQRRGRVDEARLPPHVDRWAAGRRGRQAARRRALPRSVPACPSHPSGAVRVTVCTPHPVSAGEVTEFVGVEQIIRGAGRDEHADLGRRRLRSGLARHGMSGTEPGATPPTTTSGVPAAAARPREPAADRSHGPRARPRAGPRRRGTATPRVVDPLDRELERAREGAEAIE